MINKSIAYRLSIYISIAVIVVFLAFMAITYFFNHRIIKESIQDVATGLSSKLITSVEEQLVATREVTSNVSNQTIFYSEQNHSDLLISGIMDRYPFLNAMRINIDSGVPSINYHNIFAYRDKNKIVFEKKNSIEYHCITEQRIFEKASANQEAGWTEIFTCHLNKNMVVAYYSPILYEDENHNISKIGEVITELSLSNLNEVINSLEVGKNGFAFLLSQDGDFITHPIKDYMLNRSVYDMPDDVYNKKKINMQDVLQRGLSGSLVAYPEYKDHKKHWAYYTRLNEIEWTLMIGFPYSELFEDLYLLILRMLFFSVIGILAVYLTVTYITNKLIEPLSTVTSQLKKFSSFTGKEIASLNEVQHISESLNYLKTWYENFKVEQSNEEKRSKREKQDLLQASEIQQSLIKTDFTGISSRKEIDLYAIYKPARIVSGDLFDYFLLDDETLIFTMGDVSGKGVPAALFMSVAQTIIKSNASAAYSASEIVKKANDELFTTNKHQYFLTLFLGILNLKTGELSFCNAAHTPSYVLKPNGEVIELIQTHGLPLGLYPNKEYSDSQITLDRGDCIVVYTDGITDLQNEENVQFGNKKFIENLKNLGDCNPEAMVNKIELSLDAYRGEASQIDDITLMVIKYKA